MLRIILDVNVLYIFQTPIFSFHTAKYNLQNSMIIQAMQWSHTHIFRGSFYSPLALGRFLLLTSGKGYGVFEKSTLVG